ncbi:MAG: hypothetical protein ACFCU8_19845 [Thermosynechococcaceae cyanobacterium]
MLSKPSLILSFLIVLMPGFSRLSRVQAESIEQPEPATVSNATKQPEELFLAPPLPDEPEDWAETAVPEWSEPREEKRAAPISESAQSDRKPITAPPIQTQKKAPATLTPESLPSDWVKPSPSEVAQPITQPSTVSRPKKLQSQWLELTPPEETHWRNQPSFPPPPGSQPLKPRRPDSRDRWIRPGKTQPRGRWEPWGVTPIIEPPDRLYLKERSVQPSAKVRLDDAQLQTILVDEKVHHRIIGQLLNHTPGHVYNLRVYYRIRQGLQTVDVGQFSMGADKRLAPGDRIRFAYPVPTPGELEISFVEWKYEDGTQGISERGVL